MVGVRGGLGRFSEGTQWLTAGIEKHPDSVLLHSDLARSHVGFAGRIDKAALVYSDMLRRSPQSRRGLFRMADYWLSLDDLPRAESWLRALANQYPEHLDTREMRIAITARKGDFTEARNIAREIPQSPEFVELRGELIGMLCLYLDDSDCAAENLEILEQHWQEEESDEREVSERESVSRTIFRAATMSHELRIADDGLSTAIEIMQGWPIRFVDGTNLPARANRLAAAYTLRGDYADAVAELNDTLDIPDGGILETDFVNFPPEQSVFLKALRDQSGYAEWFQEFDARRTAMREKMIAMEASGQIARPPIVPR